MTAEPVPTLDTLIVENDRVLPCDVEKVKFVVRRVEATMLETRSVFP
jgi:hypothetical protein